MLVRHGWGLSSLTLIDLWLTCPSFEWPRLFLLIRPKLISFVVQGGDEFEDMAYINDRFSGMLPLQAFRQFWPEYLNLDVSKWL